MTIRKPPRSRSEEGQEILRTISTVGQNAKHAAKANLDAPQRKLLVIIGDRGGINSNEFEYFSNKLFEGSSFSARVDFNTAVSRLIRGGLAIEHGNNTILTDAGRKRYGECVVAEGRPDPEKVEQFLSMLLSRHEIRRHNAYKDGNGLTSEGKRAYDVYLRKGAR